MTHFSSRVWVPHFSSPVLELDSKFRRTEPHGISVGCFKRMETGMDFLQSLDSDTSVKILMCLEDLSDIVRVSSVSRLWRHFVITNGLCKHLCLRIFPQLSSIKHVTELNSGAESSTEAGSSNLLEYENLERQHRVYAFLVRACMSFPLQGCILNAISASSTDNFPEESIENTLEPRDRVARRASYWSSKGQSNPDVPETLTYKLVSDLCVISEINLQPFQAYFQWGLPIYSAKAVRFRMGHLKNPSEYKSAENSGQGADKDQFVWTYTSEEFPMAQENYLQKFKLPEPVLCVGGILQIELLGRVQRQEMDGLFYICVSHVKVIGRPLSPAFDIEMLDPSGKFGLKVLSYTTPTLSEEDPSGVSSLQRRVRDLEQIVNMLQGDIVDVVEYGWGAEEDDESDEEFLI